MGRQFNNNVIMAVASLCFCLLLLSLATTTHAAGGPDNRAEGKKIGINYGRIANNLPNPEKVVQLLKSQNITNIKIFDTDSSVLTAFSNTGINLIVTLPNELLSSAASNQSYTDNWLQTNILPFHPNTQITTICVGNEVLDDPNNITQFLIPAMSNLINSLNKNNLNYKVSSPISLTSLENSYPPSSGSFKPDLLERVIKPMCELLRKTNSSLMVNAYPFLAYSDVSNKISLDYALCRKNSSTAASMLDSGNELRYDCLFDAQVDAVRSAMKAISYDDVKIIVSETGWPSKGEVGASESNAKDYNGNLVMKVLNGIGTPLKPDECLEVYLFALFNENQKPGLVSERNFGLFYPNEQRVYDIPLTVEQLDSAAA